eukprot:12755643-Heterocapsa_arctica.AAC.1
MTSSRPCGDSRRHRGPRGKIDSEMEPTTRSSETCLPARPSLPKRAVIQTCVDALRLNDLKRSDVTFLIQECSVV